MRFNVKLFFGLIVTLTLLDSSSCKSLVRNKRFFNTLWPSEVKSDVQTGLIYSQLPQQYLYLLPGVNDHKTIQRRDGAPQPPPRFVHPTRMAILMQPHLQQRSSAPQPANVKSQPLNVQNPQLGPKIVMKPVPNPNQNTKLSPSFTLKTKDQSLPDIHKNQRFIPLKPMQSALLRPSSPFNTHQHLPIKKAFDNAPSLISTGPLFSIKTASVDDLYYTKEFQDLLKEFNIRVEIKKLPPISDVMALLGTTNSEDTFNAINDVAKSSEGMELIRSYLDQTEGEGDDDEFYNYDEDIGAGEIKVDGSKEVKYLQSFEAPRAQIATPQQLQTIALQNPPTRATTAGTLTGEGKSWWKLGTWFGSAPSTKVESLTKDADILKKVVPKPGSVWQNINYVGKFLTPASKESVAINPSFNIGENPRRVFVQQPLKFTHTSIIEDTKTLPTVQMTEEQFQDMIKALKLTPMNVQHMQKPPVQIQQQRPAPEPRRPLIQSPPPAALDKFEAPINVQSQTIPLPSTIPEFTEQKPRAPQASLEPPRASLEQENRRNFVSSSEPQRSAPYDFIATGRVHQANPDEVFKRSRSLIETIEEEKSVVASISELTEKHHDGH